MDYKIVLMKDAEEDFDRFIAYLLFEKKSEQAARNLLNDFEATKISLSNVAGSLKLCDNPKLRELGYRRINFLSHRYFQNTVCQLIKTFKIKKVNFLIVCFNHCFYFCIFC